MAPVAPEVSDTLTILTVQLFPRMESALTCNSMFQWSTLDWIPLAAWLCHGNRRQWHVHVCVCARLCLCACFGGPGLTFSFGLGQVFVHDVYVSAYTHLKELPQTPSDTPGKFSPNQFINSKNTPIHSPVDTRPVTPSPGLTQLPNLAFDGKLSSDIILGGYTNLWAPSRCTEL